MVPAELARTILPGIACILAGGSLLLTDDIDDIMDILAPIGFFLEYGSGYILCRISSQE